MAEFYSMEEAARVLGIGLDDLKLKIQSGELRQVGGGAAPQFRKSEVDEFARRQGLGSDPDVQSDWSIDDLDFNDLFLGADEAAPASGTSESGKSAHSTTSHEMDINPLGSASGVTPGASDIQVVKVAPQGASDSDVRIAPMPAQKGPSDSDVTLLTSDSVELDLSDLNVTGKPTPGDTALGTVEMGSSGEIPLLMEDSEIQLTPSGVIDALRPESGSDFELPALDSSSEFETAGSNTVSAADVPGAPAGSGINLSKPNDSGISLAGFDSDSIELAPLDDDQPYKLASQPAPAPVAKPASKPGDTGVAAATSFDDTDFVIEDLGESLADFSTSDDRTIEIGESSSDMEVFASAENDLFEADDEKSLLAEPSKASGAGRKAEAASGFSEELSNEFESASDSDEFTETKPKTPAKPSPALVRAGTPTEWGTPWVVGLFFSTAMMLLLCMVAFDLLRNLYEFRGNTPVASGLVKQIAGLLGGK